MRERVERFRTRLLIGSLGVVAFGLLAAATGSGSLVLEEKMDDGPKKSGAVRAGPSLRSAAALDSAAAQHHLLGNDQRGCVRSPPGEVEAVSLTEAGMIVGIGTDLLDVGRMARELARDGAGFRDDVFTPAEVAYCEARAHPAQHFAARFAAKEACWKALGAPREGAPLRDVEVEKDGDGPPRLVLAGSAREAADRLGAKRALVSLSHTATLATATVVLEG